MTEQSANYDGVKEYRLEAKVPLRIPAGFHGSWLPAA